MSGDDFERCTPSEFSKIYECWAEHQTHRSREGWEQIRTLVSFILPMYNMKKKASELLPFSWDKENEKAAPKGSSSIERMKEIVARVNGG